MRFKSDTESDITSGKERQAFMRKNKSERTLKNIETFLMLNFTRYDVLSSQGGGHVSIVNLTSRAQKSPLHNINLLFKRVLILISTNSRLLQ